MSSATGSSTCGWRLTTLRTATPHRCCGGGRRRLRITGPWLTDAWSRWPKSCRPSCAGRLLTCRRRRDTSWRPRWRCWRCSSTVWASRFERRWRLSPRGALNLQLLHHQHHSSRLVAVTECVRNDPAADPAASSRRRDDDQLAMARRAAAPGPNHLFQLVRGKSDIEVEERVPHHLIRPYTP